MKVSSAVVSRILRGGVGGMETPSLESERDSLDLGEFLV